MSEQISASEDRNLETRKEKNKFSFRFLERIGERLKGEENKAAVQSFIKELKENCLNYLEVAGEYKKSWEQLQESGIRCNEDHQNALDEFEAKSIAKNAGKNVIIDNLNILHRLFETSGLDVSWHRAFANDEQFQEWVEERSKELDN